MVRIVFDGEYVNGETGETQEVIGWDLPTAMQRLRTMKEGDALVLNAKVE